MDSQNNVPNQKYLTIHSKKEPKKKTKSTTVLIKQYLKILFKN